VEVGSLGSLGLGSPEKGESWFWFVLVAFFLPLLFLSSCPGLDGNWCGIG